MSATPRLSLPFIVPGQAQKELFHNEALQLLDALVAGAVEEPPRNDPPATPAMGAVYIVGVSPTGEWASQANAVASFSDGGWRYLAPVDGMTLLVRSTGVHAVYRQSAWELGVVRAVSVTIGGQQVVGSRAAAVSAPAGGAVADVESRTAIAAILAALRGHGLIAT